MTACVYETSSNLMNEKCDDYVHQVDLRGEMNEVGENTDDIEDITDVSGKENEDEIAFVSIEQYCDLYMNILKEANAPADLIDLFHKRIEYIRDDMKIDHDSSHDQRLLKAIRHKDGMRDLLLNYMIMYREDIEKDPDNTGVWYVNCRVLYERTNVTIDN